MADVVRAKVPRGTDTGERGWSDTETPKLVAEVEQFRQSRLSEWVLPVSQFGIPRFASAGKELTVTPSLIEPLLISSPQQQADAVLNVTEEDLLRYMRRIRGRVAQSEPTPHLPRIDRRYIRFRDKLVTTLLDEPIEDGVAHPAESLIDEALCADSSTCQDWLSQVLAEHYLTRPSMYASVVRCIGRLDYDRVGGWGMRVVDHALKNTDAEVREAAIRALEAWEGPRALEMLRRHEDAEPWLDEYVQQVIVDLSRTTS